MTEKCAVLGCKNSKGSREASRDDLCFYPFPKEDHLFLKWEKAAGAGTLSRAKTNYICSAHFDRSCYRLQEILLKVPIGKRKLVENSVPSLNIPKTVRAEIEDILQRKKLVLELLAEHSSPQQKKPKGTNATSKEGNQSTAQNKLDALAWKLGQQQAKIFQLQKQLERFKQFFTPEEAELIAAGEMVPKASEAVTYKVEAYDEHEDVEAMETIFLSESEQAEGIIESDVGT